MAKFFGKIGYAISKDVRPGVWDGEITEREYFGDLFGIPVGIRLPINSMTISTFPMRSASWPILLLIRIFTQCGMSSSWERSERFPVLKYSIRV